MIITLEKESNEERSRKVVKEDQEQLIKSPQSDQDSAYMGKSQSRGKAS